MFTYVKRKPYWNKYFKHEIKLLIEIIWWALKITCFKIIVCD